MTAEFGCTAYLCMQPKRVIDGVSPSPEVQRRALRETVPSLWSYPWVEANPKACVPPGALAVTVCGAVEGSGGREAGGCESSLPGRLLSAELQPRVLWAGDLFGDGVLWSWPLPTLLPVHPAWSSSLLPGPALELADCGLYTLRAKINLSAFKAWILDLCPSHWIVTETVDNSRPSGDLKGTLKSVSRDFCGSLAQNKWSAVGSAGQGLCSELTQCSPQTGPASGRTEWLWLPW